MRRKTLNCPTLPSYQCEELPPEAEKWHTKGNPNLRAVALHWPEDIHSILTYPVKDGLTKALVEFHYRRYVEPTLRERLREAQPLGSVQ